MPRAASGATMTRPQATAATVPKISPQNILFQYGNWIGLPANNQWGFDILNLTGDYYSSIVQAQDFNALMQCFALYLKDHGVPIATTGAFSGLATAQRRNTTGVGLTRNGRTRARGGNTRSRVSVSRVGSTEAVGSNT